MTNQSGTLYFSRLGTGLNKTTSDNAIASFLLGLGAQFQVTNIDISSLSFGMWDGTVSAPRNIQFGLKLLF